MGLGGYLAWTGVIRELAPRLPENTKILPCEMHGNQITKIVKSPVFECNPHVYNGEEGVKLFPLVLNNPKANYCKLDTPTYTKQRYDKHMIAQMCEVYGIQDPDIQCEMFFLDEEREQVSNLLQKEGIGKDYIVIEPHSKENYTPNRKYSFKKWQNVVNSLKHKIQFVQIGAPRSEVLEDVVSLVGKITFREAALVIEKSRIFVSTEGGLSHAANAVKKRSLIVLTGYQGYDMVAYPNNINVDISTHGPCGLKIDCDKCSDDVYNHNENDIVDLLEKELFKNEQ